MLPMWPSLPGFKLQAVNYIDDEFILVARASRAMSVCPICKKNPRPSTAGMNVLRRICQVAVLLSDREADILAEWLKAHPSVENVTRDRSSSYAAGVNEGTPKAIQVADRWHLASNLVEAIEATLARYPSRLHVEPMPEKKENTSSKAPPDAEKQTTVKTDLS